MTLRLLLARYLAGELAQPLVVRMFPKIVHPLSRTRSHSLRWDRVRPVTCSQISGKPPSVNARHLQIGFSNPEAARQSIACQTVVTRRQVNLPPIRGARVSDNHIGFSIRSYPFPVRLGGSQRLTYDHEWERILANAHARVIRGIHQGQAFLGELDEGFQTLTELSAAITTAMHPGTLSDVSVWHKFPGAMALFLVQVAIYYYHHGEYWTVVNNRFVRMDSYVQCRWGSRFRCFAAIFGLPMGDQVKQRKGIYVNPILLHAMIPNDCLPGFFELLEQAVRSPDVIGVDVHELIRQWLHQNNALSRPVYDFLWYGDKRAEQTVAGALKMVEYRRDQGEVIADGDFGLPARMVREYAEWVREGGGRRFAARLRKPALRLDPSSQVVLDLPEQELAHRDGSPLGMWEIFGEETGPIPFYTQGWVTSSGMKYGSQTAFVSPDKVYKIAFRAGDTKPALWEIPGVDPLRPWLVFSDRDCRVVDGESSLPPEPTWFVVPVGWSVRASEPMAERKYLKHARLLERWRDYDSVLIDLSREQCVEIAGNNRSWHIAVDCSHIQLAIDGGKLLQSGELTTDGIPLYGAELPRLRLGKLPQSTTWRSRTFLELTVKGPNGPHPCDPQSLDAFSQQISELSDAHYLQLNDLFLDAAPSGEVALKIWTPDGSRKEIRFRWAVGLFWTWDVAMNHFVVRLPESTQLQVSASSSEDEAICCRSAQPSEYHVSFSDNFYVSDVQLNWPMSKNPAFAILLRLERPHWALLSEGTKMPVWHTRPMEFPYEHLCAMNEPELLVEARDFAWCGAVMSARFRCPERCITQELKSIASTRAGRWRIPLALGMDTFRHCEKYAGEITLRLVPPETATKGEVAIAVMRLLPPIRSVETQERDEQEARTPWRNGCTKHAHITPELSELINEVLCSLSPKCSHTLDSIARTIPAPPGAVRRAIERARLTYAIIEHEGAFTVTSITWRQINQDQDLDDWWNSRHGT